MSDGTGTEASALVAWSALAEPDDPLALGIVAALGATEALAWVRSCAGSGVLLSPPALDRKQRDALVGALPRWVARLPEADPRALRERADLLGARLVTRGGRGWPPALDRLGAAAPFALWIRGELDPAASWSRSIALVGARAATAYGEHVAGAIAAEAAARGIAVISGGAYGIDAAAHRATLACVGAPIAVLAGGVDRLYPAGNTRMLEQVVACGAVVSEQPPGRAPMRHRFLSRNRLIAAASATIVVEAAARSGALNTARHASELARPVGAVPGPVTSGASAGCHALIRAGAAVLVTGPGEALELAAPLGEVDEPAAVGSDGRTDFGSAQERAAHAGIGARGSTTDAIARAAGLTGGQAQAALGGLSLRGLVELRDGRWHRLSP
ncbi:DNA-processing protein DprA [Demequina sp. SYSU T00039]|uniref:DNA-processing protein DprA n=1 Tax=Demequina lignilytica TaxID=3051663 RepID=A0AAW7M8V8_9MICO|nr:MULTISPECIES: DNA-processing protein DprA [unclassified Demequina]MDN4477198.1 DNA-processing protein DprA [Demequina sp. SYSU T00039-1]MDN4487371.1 DNA-processing protein DprA [Demequina sp. SYSU T00039]MDN4491124.1 DNA-processing protein DprA [Demequina sp. SYSU T00068]